MTARRLVGRFSVIGPGTPEWYYVTDSDASKLEACIAAADEMKRGVVWGPDPETWEYRCLICGNFGNKPNEIEHGGDCPVPAYDAARKEVAP